MKTVNLETHFINFISARFLYCAMLKPIAAATGLDDILLMESYHTKPV